MNTLCVYLLKYKFYGGFIMKKLFVALILVGLMFTTACANDDKMTFDDVTFSKAYKIKGYASITLLGFKFIDVYAQWDDGKASPNITGWGNWDSQNVYIDKKYNKRHVDAYYKDSGEETDFAWLKVDVTNLQKTDATFIGDITVKVIYDDEYEYDGWVRQFNYDFSKSEIYRYQGKTTIGWPVCLSPVDEMPIKPMYKGHYALGCTLPNIVIEDKSAPLRMVITMDDHKLTYNIR